MRKRLVVLVVGLGMCLVGGSAAAHTSPANDPDDIKGSLDLRRVNFADDEDRITVAWWTWDEFGSAPFHDGGFLDIIIHPKNDDMGSATVTVDHRKGKWVADLDVLGDDGWTSKTLPVGRPFAKIARVRIPRSLLPDSLQGKIQWTASSRLNGEPGPGAPADYVPESGWRPHDLSAA